MKSTIFVFNLNILANTKWSFQMEICIIGCWPRIKVVMKTYKIRLHTFISYSSFKSVLSYGKSNICQKASTKHQVSDPKDISFFNQ